MTAAPRLPHESDRGSATLEIAILFPALLLLTFGLIQGALWYHARTVALAAATDGLHASTVQTGSASAGQQAANAFISSAGGTDVLIGSAVSVQLGEQTATVTVTGSSISLLPGVPGPSVEQAASGPVERFTTADTP